MSLCCKSFKIPPLIGLENIGSTYYMNAILQCLSQTEVLTNYFLNEKNINKIMNNNVAKKNPNYLQLSPNYYNLIHNLWSNQPNKCFSPKEFLIKLANINPLFNGRLLSNPTALISFILMQLHHELNLYDGNNKSNFNCDKIMNNNLKNQYNEQIALTNFTQNIFSKNNSVLKNHFFGILESKFICLRCQKKYIGKGLPPIYFNFEAFNSLVFPLEKVLIYRNKKIMMSQIDMNNIMDNNKFNNMSQILYNNQVNIYDCFEYFQKEKNLNMWCNECKALFPTKTQKFINTGPNVLIIIFNRKREGVKLDYFETIDLNNYITKEDRISKIYNLYGVVTYLEECEDKKQFIASCKSPCENKWYTYNDDIVTPIKDIQKEIIDFGNPYILFYQKTKN